MKTERFEFQNKDIPMLKKDIFFRMFFMSLFVFVFVWQFVLFILHYMRDDLSKLNLIVTIIILIVSLLFAVISLAYAIRSLAIIQKIRLHGSAVKQITIISNAKSNSFLRLYSIITQLIAFVMIVILASAITYSILQYVYFTTQSYYLPILFFVSFAGFNSVYHIKEEIKTIQNVREFKNFF